MHIDFFLNNNNEFQEYAKIANKIWKKISIFVCSKRETIKLHAILIVNFLTIHFITFNS